MLDKNKIISIEMREMFIKKQASLVVMNYKDDEGNICDLFQVHENGVMVHEKDYGKDTKTFDEYVQDYYDISYTNYYFPPSNTSIS